jgi:hypothetical protein
LVQLVDDAQDARVQCFFYLRVGPVSRAGAATDEGTAVVMDELVLYDTKAALHNLSVQLEQAVLRTSRRWRRSIQHSDQVSS